jgi:Kef-type K+ transport system membrane component KefB
MSASLPTFLTREVMYVILLFALFVLPRILVRLRIPTASTSFGLGALAGMGFGLFPHDHTIELLSTFGIVALFLFAGLDVDFDELRHGAAVVAQHVVIRVGLVAAAVAALSPLLDLGWRAAALVALALLTPSGGFILDSLKGFGASDRERFWIKSKVIATEMVALVLLFVILQTESLSRLATSSLILIGMIILVPMAFRFFAAVIVPYAPRSEFAFLVMVAVVCAMITLKLGVYYLLGAFVVGVAAQRFRERLPAVGSEQMLHAVESFASLFVPFYFFHAGLLLQRSDFGIGALAIGGAFLALGIPLRLLFVALHRRVALGESFRTGMRISLMMIPTLVFTLVIAGILRDRFNAAPALVGGLIIYTIVNTLLPGLFLKLPPPSFDAPHSLVPGDAYADYPPRPAENKNPA